MQAKTIYRDGNEYIYDPVRRKYVFLSPEEWVRQQVLHHLIHDLSYPAKLISVEKQIRIGSRSKRYDIVVYKEGVPKMLIECKQEKEKISERSVQQILSYNTEIKAGYLVVSNGPQLFVFHVESHTWTGHFPKYSEI